MEIFTYINFYNYSLAFLILCSISGWLLPSKSIFQYGRLKQASKLISVNPKIGWFIMEINNLLWAIYFLIYLNDKLHFGYVLFIIHYINRTIIYPLKMKSNNEMPLGVVASAWGFTLANGYLQGKSNQLQENDEWGVLQVVGAILFFAGMYINIESDNILQKTKEKNASKKIEEESKGLSDNKIAKLHHYTVINEFLFKYVSNPNYFGEIIEWLGYFIFCQRIEPLAFCLSTFNVLVSAAISRNKWNKENIDGYPKDRKAVIPFLI